MMPQQILWVRGGRGGIYTTIAGEIGGGEFLAFG